MFSACTAENTRPPHDSVDPTASSGHLPAGQVDIRECVIASVGDELLLGDVLGPADADVELRGIEFTGLTGLHVLHTYLLDPAFGDLIASATKIPSDEPIWQNREAAIGAVLRPGDVRNLVLQVEVLTPVAGFDSLTIDYNADGSESTVQTRRSFRVAEKCD